ncbi:MAG: hypothetical protein AAGI69_19945 [Cyanobacteria bacterium P01_H01_bin.21]
MNKITAQALSEIDRRGFIHIPSFLSDEEIAQFRQDFNNRKPIGNGNYHIRSVSPNVFALFRERLGDIAKQVSEQTNVLVNELPGTGYYFSTWKEQGNATENIAPKKQRFAWHIDHESFFTLQDHTNYLNCYIPVIKPVLERSNLSVIPLDRLAERLPRINKYLVGRGAIRIVRDRQGNNVILDDDQGGIIARLDFSVNEIEETPCLHPGDLLLIRGDVLHQTQDTSTQRVAVSFRLSNRDAIISRDKLISGGLVKTVMMFNNWFPYELIFRYFDDSNSDTATRSAIDDYTFRKKLPPDFNRYHFLLRLLKAKVLAGNLLKTILDIRRLPLILRDLP